MEIYNPKKTKTERRIIMIRNVNKVAKEQWRKWDDTARNVFNECFDYFKSNQTVIKHPKASKLPEEQWDTVAWNMAWIAACVCNDRPLNKTTP